MVWVSAQNILDFSCHACKHVDSITCSAQIHTACSSFHAPWDPKNHTDQRRSSAIFKSLRPRRMIKTFCQWKHIPRNIIQLICTVPDIHSQLYARLFPHTCFAGQGRQCKWPSKQRADSGHVNKCQGRHSTLEGANLIFAWSVCVGCKGEFLVYALLQIVNILIFIFKPWFKWRFWSKFLNLNQSISWPLALDHKKAQNHYTKKL